jgi:hypothetical protein
VSAPPGPGLGRTASNTTVMPTWIKKRLTLLFYFDLNGSRFVQKAPGRLEGTNMFLPNTMYDLE